MRLSSFNILVINPLKASKPRQVFIHPVVLFCSICFCLLCLFGLGKLFFFATSYTIAKIDCYEEKLKNERLQAKILVIEKIISMEITKIEKMVDFEDRTRLAFGMDPISDDVRKAGIGGLPIPDDYEIKSFIDPTISKAEGIKQHLSGLLRRTQLQITTFDQMNGLVKNQVDYWNHRPSIWPAAGRLTSCYGLRYDPVYGGQLFHDGLDIANAIGTPVYATADGIIKQNAYIHDYGLTIIIAHQESDLESLYAHLYRTAVNPKDTVKRGDLVGYIGNSGKSTGPHLHYEIRKNGSSSNPMSYILPADQIVD